MIEIKQVFEIRTDGCIFKAEWKSDKYNTIKPRYRREEIFSV